VVEQFPILLGTRLFRSQRESHISSCTTTYYSHTKLDSAVYAVIIVAGLLLLISPMWALQFVTEDVKRLAIITGFILVFTALLSSATVAKPFEVLAATAACVTTAPTDESRDADVKVYFKILCSIDGFLADGSRLKLTAAVLISLYNITLLLSLPRHLSAP